MKLTYFVIATFLVLSACRLNADQETALHQASTSYINAFNEGIAARYVAYTHPDAVAYYKAQGDSIFKMRYNLSGGDERPYLQDGNIEDIESDGNMIQVRYSYLRVHPLDYTVRQDQVTIIAMSSNNGKSWFFLDEDDYWNDAIISPKERLLNR